MTEEALANAKHVWDCRWSKLGYRLPRDGQDRPDTAWTCARVPAAPRPVTDEECATCSGWEPDPNNLR